MTSVLLMRSSTQPERFFSFQRPKAGPNSLRSPGQDGLALSGPSLRTASSSNFSLLAYKGSSLSTGESDLTRFFLRQAALVGVINQAGWDLAIPI